MKNYMIIGLDNDVKYLVVDMLECNEKKYFLLTEVMSDGYSLGNEFDICLYDDKHNYFVLIDDEYEYNNIKDIFNNRLNEEKQKLHSLDDNLMLDMIKLKVVNINGLEYTLEKVDGQTLMMNIEIFGDFKIQINDYVYMREDTTKESITVRFGVLYTDKNELIRIERDGSIYYLQRYYG